MREHGYNLERLYSVADRLSALGGQMVPMYDSGPTSCWDLSGRLLWLPSEANRPEDFKRLLDEAEITVLTAERDAARAERGVTAPPLDMVLHCPACGTQHIDHSDEASGWTNPPHRSHLCANQDCGTIWRPADVPTNGVAEAKTRGQRDTWSVPRGVLKQIGAPQREPREDVEHG